MKAKLKIYDKPKYHTDSKKTGEVIYNDVTGWEVVSGTDAELIEAESDGSLIDPLHEYLVLEFGCGGSATFRNSHVDLFSV